MDVVSRGRTGGSLLAALLVSLGAPAAAQPAPLPPTEIGQIIDAVLEALVPPSESLSRVSIAKRSIFLDYERTLAAFGHRSDSPALRSQLGLKRSVSAGTLSLLSDCEQLRRQACTRIGWDVYVSVRPVSVTDSDALVRARVVWADRGAAPVEEGTPPKGPASLVGYGIEVFLSRSPDGRWKFVRTGTAMAT